MAASIIRIKRSSVSGKIPSANDVPLGELALNTYDGKLYASKNVGIGTTVFAVNPWTVGVGSNTYNTFFTAGSVGIGTTNATRTFDVNGDIRLHGGLYVGAANTSGTFRQVLQSTGVGVTWSSNGIIGIGTEFPSSASNGDLFYSAEYARLFVYYDEDVLGIGTDAFWVDAAPFNVAALSLGTYLSYNAGTTFDGGTARTINVTASTSGNTNLVARDPSGNFSAGTITAALSGNADTATILATARTIGGVSFNGSANINLPGVNTDGNQNTSGNAASATILQTTRTIGGVSFNGSANINLPGVNTAGNQNTSGNAATATNLSSNRTFALTGDVTGSVSSNLSSGASIAATIAAGIIDNANISASAGIVDTKLATISTAGKVADSALPPSISSSITGNAASATILQTTRTIGGVSFNGSANINLPGVNTAGNQNTSGNAATVTNGVYKDTNNSGSLTFGTLNTNPANNNVDGVAITDGGLVSCSRNDLHSLAFCRRLSDGAVATIHQGANQEGSISVSGTTVSYNAFLGSHWTRLADNSKPEILVGTILETIDKLVEWKCIRFEVDGEQQIAPYYGSADFGETASIEYEGSTYAGIIETEGNGEGSVIDINKHVCVKVSDTLKSTAVYGVFVSWDVDPMEGMTGAWNDIICGSVGNYVIRMAPGETPAIGDLFQSGGNGCAIVQDDDLIRSSTIGKITSTIPQRTYDDGSFLVACVLYCG
jgi:hypothetical protein